MAPEASNDEWERQTIQQRQYFAAKIGETSRFIGFGLIAIFYAILSNDERLAGVIETQATGFLYAAGLLGCLTVLADHFQYVSGKIATEAAFKSKNKNYQYSSRSYRVSEVLFTMKQWFAGVGAVCLIASLVLAFPAL